MSSSGHVDNKKKDISILGKGPTQGLDGTTLTAEKLHSVNFTEKDKKFCLSLHYNGKTVMYLLIVQKFISLKQKIQRL